MVAVTKIGNPVYTNCFDRRLFSVNKVKTVKIHKSIKTHDCRSRSMCSSFFLNLLLEMNIVNEQQTKVLQ